MYRSHAPKKFAISLRGGLVRGLGSIGLIRFLQENKLEPTILAGSSSGAWAATLYGLGFSWSQILELFSDVKVFNHLSLIRLLMKGGLIDFPEFKKLTRQLLGPGLENYRIEDLPRRLILFASDRSTNEKLPITSGNLLEALFVSSSYPLITSLPPKVKPFLTDGDFVPGYGAKYLRSQGVDVVVGASYKGKPPSRKTVSSKPLDNVLDLARMIGEEMHQMVIQIDPPDAEVIYFASDRSYFDFKAISELADRGYREAMQQEQQLLKLLT